MMLWRDRVPSHPREAAQGGSLRQRSGWQLASGSVAEANERYIMAAFGNAWAQALVQLAAPEEGDRVLDVACGTGPVARYAAALVGPSGRVIGLDLNAGMLAIARALPQREGIAIEWREGDAWPWRCGVAWSISPSTPR